MSCEVHFLGPDESEKKEETPATGQEFIGEWWPSIVQQFGWVLGDRDPLTGEWRTP